MQSYKDLFAWQKAYELTKSVYTLTRSFPTSEMFGLVSQMRRAAVSIPSNLAEGYYRGSHMEYLRFCRIAYASAAELETQISLAKDLKLAPDASFEDCADLSNQTLRLLNRLCASLMKSKNLQR